MNRSIQAAPADADDVAEHRMLKLSDRFNNKSPDNPRGQAAVNNTNTDSSSPERVTSYMDTTDDIIAEDENEDNWTIKQKKQKVLDYIHKRENNHFHWTRFPIFVIGLVIQIIFGLLMGSFTFDSVVGVSMCSFTYWALYFLLLFIYFVMFLLSFKML